jgi:hypothetical protein
MLYVATFAGILSMVSAAASMWLAWYLLTPCVDCGKVGNRGIFKPCCPPGQQCIITSPDQHCEPGQDCR